MAALATACVVGSNAFSVRDRLLGTALPDAEAPATSRHAGEPAPGEAERMALRSAPWWQVVATLEGTGNTRPDPFTIDRRAVDWRVTTSCEQGRLVVRSSGQQRPLVDAQCPQGVGFSDRTGPARLEVSAEGPWRIEVAQRVDLPLVEPALPAMTAPGAKALATGSFRKVARVGAGEVTIYEHPDGGYSIRLEDFWVTPRSALQLRLSAAESPRSTKDYLGARSQFLAALDVTAGSLNHVPPTGVEVAGFRSLVVWSPTDDLVYAAAPLDVVS
ncbi:MAG: hypothetical protein ACRD0N_12175 [Acidimicrobiales bacterium]